MSCAPNQAQLTEEPPRCSPPLAHLLLPPHRPPCPQSPPALSLTAFPPSILTSHPARPPLRVPPPFLRGASAAVPPGRPPDNRNVVPFVGLLTPEFSTPPRFPYFVGVLWFLLSVHHFIPPLYIYIYFFFKFIYLLYYNLNPNTAGSARINAKERGKTEEKERDLAAEGKTLYSILGN